MDETNINYYFNNLNEDFIVPKIFKDIRFIWEALVNMNNYLSVLVETKISANVDNSAIIRGIVEIGEGTVIEPYVVIDGPVVIGKNCLIRPHSYIRKNTIISDDVVVGHGVEIKNSIIFKDCKLDSHSFVGDSIFGKGVRNGSGTLTANRRFDQKNIIVKIKDTTFETNLDKFGCVIGDYTRIGAGSTILPGIHIGQHAFVYPHSLIKDFIASDSFLKIKQQQTIGVKERIILDKYDSLGNI